MKMRVIALAVLLTALVNMLPMLLSPPTGDSIFHLVLIKCFAEQFWQGDFYPRWCMNGNAGLGAPEMLFYFPLPYYVTTLLYPLTHLGVSLYGIYALSLMLATFVSGLTCYFWLKDIVSPPRALLAALLFMFVPYRMEAMFFRAAYAEIWCIALLPLFFKYVRRLAASHPQSGRELLPLASIFALLMLSHLPCAAAAAIAGGIYVLIVPMEKWRVLWRYAVSLLWGMSLAAFYVIPAAYYKPFLFKAPLFIPGHSRGWPNTFLTMYQVENQSRVVVTIALSIFVLTLLFIAILRRRGQIGDALVRREIMAWMVIFAVSVFLLFPISAPVYALIGPLTQVVFPWRMQNVFAPCLVFLLAVWMQWLVSARRMKTWQGDYGMLLALMVLLSYFVVAIPTPYFLELSEKQVGSYYDATPEYRTEWTDEDHFSLEYITARHEKKSIPVAEVISGKGNVTVEHWAWDGITLEAQSAHGMIVRLNHHYFPIWSARANDGEPLTLRPEPATGQMLLDISAGKHRIALHHSIINGNPWLVGFAYAISALAAFLCLGVFYRRQEIFDKAKNAC